MNAPQNSFSEPRELARLLIVYWRRWGFTTLLIAAAAVVYALLAPKSWQATQALIVRNEAVGNDSDQARPRGPDDLKDIQETIVELAKSNSVLRGALAEVGPPVNYKRPSAWPSDVDVESLQRAVKIVPPKGVEFGTSEVFYLEVRDKDRRRVLDLSTALCRQLQRELQDIRGAKAQSMVGELEKAVQVARADLREATAKLTALEKEVGSDLPELRSLLDSNSSDTSLRRTITEVENELRQYRASEEANRQLLGLLDEAQADPKRLVAAPTRLLESQPALRRLKDGLVDAELRTATLEGRMSPDHPEVIAAAEAEQQVAARLHGELATAIRGVEAELAFAVSRLQFLEHQRERAAARVDHLAGLRANYTNLLGEAGNRAKLLERAEQSLALARSTGASAKTATLLAAVDGPDTGANPVGPGGLTIVLGGLVGGLLTGLGLVVLTAPVATRIANGETGRAVQSVAGAAASPLGISTTVVLPYRVSESSPQTSAVAGDSWSLTVRAEGSLCSAQPLQVGNERGQLNGSLA